MRDNPAPKTSFAFQPSYACPVTKIVPSNLDT